VACLIGIRPEDISIRPRKRIVGDYSDERYLRQALRTLASIKKGKPDKGKSGLPKRSTITCLTGELQE
jgi:hypothetical protein